MLQRNSKNMPADTLQETSDSCSICRNRPCRRDTSWPCADDLKDFLRFPPILIRLDQPGLARSDSAISAIRGLVPGPVSLSGGVFHAS